MANGDTAPLKEPPDLSIYDERWRPWLGMLIIGGFFAFVAFAWVRPPLLPGDTVGAILGTMGTLSTMVATFYYQTIKMKNGK